jgi:DNA helicase IV
VPSSEASPAPDPTLEAERGHLADARRQLTRMRERTESLDAKSGDAVSAAFLASTLYHRARSLQDDPSSPLFFGRIDVAGGLTPGRWYVGRRHIHDDHGDPVVVDWRADVSRAFYRATRLEPMDVTLRRRFGFERGVLTAYEDEHLVDRAEADRRSAILASEIERPRTGPMRDIVATIQPEQDVVVRTDLATSVCVQGAPGTGKTAVGLHRAAWLLYAHRDRLRRSGVLVVGPNRAFLSYIGQVLPALGEVEVSQTTVDELVGHAVPVRAVDPADVALLKGDARMAQVLERAVWSPLRPPRETLVVPIGSRRWRCPRTSPATRCTPCGSGGSGTPPDGRHCRSAWPTRCSSSWSVRERRPTTASRTRSLAAGR